MKHMNHVSSIGSRTSRDDLAGLPIAMAAAQLDMPVPKAKQWLGKHGYRVASGRVRAIRTATEIQDEITARIAAAPPSAPCFLCGAARHCEHR